MNGEKNKTILDLGMKLRVAYNHDRQYLEKLIVYKEYVDSVYFAPNIKIFPSSGAFISPHIRWDLYDEELYSIVKFLKKNSIKTFMLLNATRFDPDILRNYRQSAFRQYLKKLINEFGLENFVVASLPLAIQIKSDFEHINLEISILAGVDSLEKLREWMECVDVKGVCLHQRLNKKLDELKKIKEKTKLQLSLIVNNPCLVECPNEISHNNFTAYLGCERSQYNCGLVLSASPWEAFRQAKIVPANLKYYKGIIDVIKLEGRSETTENLIKLVKEYLTDLDSTDYPSVGFGREFPFYHPYYKRTEPPGVFEKVSRCDNNCEECGYCYKTWKEFYNLGEFIDDCVDAYKFLAKDEYSKALERFEKYLKNANLREVNQDVFFRAGLCCQEVGKFLQAIDYLLSALKTGSKNKYEIHFKLGLCYLEVNKINEALDSFSSALREIPLGESHSPALFYSGICNHNLEQYEQAINKFLSAEKSAKDDEKGRIYYNLGMAYQELGRHNEAIKSFEEAYRRSSGEKDLGEIKYQIAFSKINLGYVDDAKGLLIQALKSNPDRAEIYSLLGGIYKDENDNDSAIAILEEGSRRFPGNWEYYNLLGACYRSQGKYEESVKMLKQAIKIMPAEWRNYNVLGNVYSKINNYNEARKMYERALTLCTDEVYKSKIKNSLEKINSNKTG